MLNKYLLFFIFFFTTSLIKGQDKWTLKQCIDYALNNSNTLKQAKLNTDLAKTNLTQTQLSNLPNLNSFATHSYNFGQTIDRYTNQFANQRVQSNNFGLSSNVNIFNGLQNYNNWQQNKTSYQAAQFDEEKTKNDLVLNILNAYLQILFAKENITINKNQVELTQKQIERTKKLVETGVTNKGTLLQLEAQLANEELQLISTENSYQLAKLNLALLLNLEYPEKFDIESIPVQVPNDNALAVNAEGVYTLAEQSLPEIKSAELKLKSSEFALASARGALFPSINFNATIATGYSGLRKNFSNPVIIGYQPYITPDQTSTFLQPIYSYKTVTTQPFNEQFKNNINKSIGFNLNFPVFNGWQTQTAIKRAKINLMNQKINYDNTKNQLRKNVQQSLADAIAAQKKYYATLKSKNAQAENLKYAEQRFQLGAINSIDYNDAKNRYTKAEIDLLQAKYDYLFKVKILEFYQGKTLVID